MAVAKSLELIARSDSTFSRIMERLPTYISDFREDPRWLLMFTLGRTSVGRRFHQPSNVSAEAANDQTTPSMFSATRSTVIAALSKDGLFEDLLLPEHVTEAISAFAMRTPCFGNHDRALDLLPDQQAAQQSTDHPVTSGHYFERVNDCPEVLAVQTDPLLQAVARGYLGQKARVISTRLWWSFPAPVADAMGETPPREMLHFDLDDWRMLKFFFYLTPVDAGCGPHLYMRGTHRHHAMKHQLSLTVGRPMDEVVSVYGADRLMSIHGDAGRGFAEDPYGFHAGSLANTQSRLMLEIGFGVTPPSRRRFYGERILTGSSSH